MAMRIFARVNNVITWWKVAVPVLAIIVLLGQFHGGNFTVGGTGFMPGGIEALFGALPGAGIIFAYFGFEQANQLAGEIKNPQRNVPQAIIISVLVAAGIYCLVQVAFIGAMPASQLAHGFAGITKPDILSGPVAGLAGILGLSGWLAFILRIDGFVSAAGTGLIYTTGTSRVSYGLARNRYFPQIFSEVSSKRIPWVGAADSPWPPPAIYGHLSPASTSEPVIRVMAAPGPRGGASASTHHEPGRSIGVVSAKAAGCHTVEWGDLSQAATRRSFLKRCHPPEVHVARRLAVERVADLVQGGRSAGTLVRPTAP